VGEQSNQLTWFGVGRRHGRHQPFVGGVVIKECLLLRSLLVLDDAREGEAAYFLGCDVSRHHKYVALEETLVPCSNFLAPHEGAFLKSSTEKLVTSMTVNGDVLLSEKNNKQRRTINNKFGKAEKLFIKIKVYTLRF